MRFRYRFAEQVVGLFVVAAIVGTAAVMVLLGINNRWFAKDYLFESRFDSASGLSVGMPINLKGFEIGSLRDITLAQDNTVTVDFVIYDTYYDRVKPNSIIELVTSPIGLGGGLEFHSGANELPPLPEFGYVPSLDMPEGRELLNAGLVAYPREIGEIEQILTSVGELVAELSDAVTGRGDGPLAQTITSLNELIVSLNEAVIGTGVGPIANAFNDLANLAESLNDAVRGVGIGPLADALQDVNEITSSIEGQLAGAEAGAIADVLLEVANLARDLTASIEGRSEGCHSTPGRTGIVNTGR